MHIATFASISWEACTNSRNQPRLRPALVLSDTFLKTYSLSQKPARVASASSTAALAPLEDINFTKIAIKFSRRLTKDLVFCDVRDLLQRLGQVAGSGAALSVAFCFGRLVAKNRCVSVLFDPQRVPRALEDQLARSALGSPPASISAADLDGDEPYYSSSSPGNDAAAADGGNNAAPSSGSESWSNPHPHVFPTDGVEALATSRSNPENVISTAGADVSIEEELQLYDALLSPPPPSDATPTARGRVFESAFRRHIASLAGDVGREAKHALDEHLQQRRDVEAMALEAKMRRLSAEDIQRYLRGQMQHREEAVAGEKLDRRSTDPSANSFYSESEQARRGFEDKEFLRRVKLELKEQLQEQMSAKEHERLSARQRTLDDDRSFLRRVRAEMEALEQKQARDREELRQTLTGSWSRDAGLKQLAATRKKQLAAAQLAHPPNHQQSHEGGKNESLASPMRAVAAAPTPRVSMSSCGNRTVGALLSPRQQRQDDDYSVGFDIRSVSGG